MCTTGVPTAAMECLTNTTSAAIPSDTAARAEHLEWKRQLMGSSGSGEVLYLQSPNCLRGKVFSHCLKGDGGGGGLLVLREILEPNIVYTHMLPSRTHYNLNPQSILVNEKVLPVDPSVFVTSNSKGTIIDSGTTLQHLLGDAYDHFVAAINEAVRGQVTLSNSNGSHCYLVT